MSKVTTILCDICKEDCHTPNTMQYHTPEHNGYNTGIRITLTGKYQQDLDTCLKCQHLAAIEWIRAWELDDRKP